MLDGIWWTRGMHEFIGQALPVILRDFLALLSVQVQDLIKIISPQEYDAAVERCPEWCPLFAAGDIRCGQQVRDSI
jgi:hypothetical protein